MLSAVSRLLLKSSGHAGGTDRDRVTDRDRDRNQGPSAGGQIRVPSAADLSPSGLVRAGDLRQRNKKNVFPKGPRQC